MNPRAAKRLARYAFTAGALFFCWAHPVTGSAASTWFTTTDTDFNAGTKVGVQTRGTGVPAILELYRDWTTLAPSGPPSTRSTQGVWDAQKNRLFVFGGATADGVQSNQTWALAPGTTAWTLLSPGTSPSVRERVGLAYSTSTKLVYAFYGEDSVNYMRQLWTYDATADTTWTLQAGGASSPTARSSAGTAYDEVGNRLIIFGGDDGTSLSDTWAWNTAGSSWTNLAPGTFPGGRLGAAMTYAGNGKIVLFGGDSTGTLKNDTWIFVSTGNTWTSQKAAPAGLFARKRSQLSYDPDLNRVILFGGQGADAGGVAYNDLWYYDVDGDSWSKVDVANPPTARSESAAAYSQSQKKLYMFGGSGNTGPSTRFGDTRSYALTVSADASATWTMALPFVSGAVKWGNLSWTPAKSSQPFQNPEPVKFQIVAQNVPTLTAPLEGPVNTGDYFVETSTTSVTIPVRWDGLPYLFLRAYFTGSSTATPHLDSITITDNRPPTVPTLSGPADGSSSASATPTFTWAGSTDTDNDTLRYRIHISTTDPTVSTATLYGGSGDTPLTATSFTPSTLNEGRYYWAVEAFDSAVYPPIRPDAASGWSAIQSVNVLPGLTVDSQGTDTILAGTVPVNWTLLRAGSVTHTFAIQMDWGAGFGYTVVIATGLPNGTTTYNWDTQKVPNANITPGPYRLQVQAIGPYGDATAESASTFRVVNGSPLSFSVLTPAVSSEPWSGTQTLRWIFPHLLGTQEWDWTLGIQISTVGASAPDSDWKPIVYLQSPAVGNGSTPTFPEEPTNVPPFYSTNTISQPWGTAQYADGSSTINNVPTWVRVYLADAGSPVRQATVTAPGTIVLVNTNQPPNAFTLLTPGSGAIVGGTAVNFSWTNTGNPGSEDKPTGYDYVNYTLYVSSNSAFASKSFKSEIESFSPKTSVSVPNVNMSAVAKGGTVSATLTLNDKTTYYWKVVGVDTQGSFRVMSDPGYYFQVNTGGGVTANISQDADISIISGPSITPGFERRSATFTADTASLPSALAAKQPTVKRANDTLRATAFTRLASTVAYEIGVFNGAWDPDPAFKGATMKARIAVKFPSADGKVLDNTTIPVENLRLVRLNEATGEWDLTENQSVNSKDRKVEATVTRFSTFALLAYASPGGVLDGLKSYPNPFAAGRDSCTMAYMLTKDSRIALKVYSGAGDLVWQKNVEPPDPAATAQPVSPRKIVWDGRNEDGRIVANGGYLLRLTVSPVDGSAEETMTWKLAVLK